MKTRELRFEQIIPANRHTVFSFFEQPGNLALLTPPSLGFRIVSGRPIEMKSGAVIDYKIRILGLPISWQSEILDYHPPDRFADIQRKGPYAYWHHQHLFTDAGDGTRMLDIVNYALPMGVLGTIAETLFVKRQLHEIFRFRRKTIEKQFS